MHQGMDLRKFKKVASDKKTSTLRHAKGHEIKIAHDAVSPKMREEIAKLPIYMAEGGEAEAPEVDEVPEEPTLAPEPEAEAPPPPVAEPEPDVEPTPEPGPTAPNGPKDDDANTIVVTGYRQPHAPTAQDLDNEDELFAQDMQRGHVKPETLQGLYDKKDTLGKIGTLFGLLVSGMGSGLSGQPNAVLEMMNQQIKNDFEGQQKSNENAQNWLRLSQQHHMNKANIKKMAIENEYTKAKTEAVPSEVERNKAATEQARAAADLESTNAAMNRMRLTAAGYLEQKVNKMPDGPAKAQATGALQNQVLPAIKAQNAAGNAETAAKVGAINALSGKSDGSQLVDSKKIQDLAYSWNKAQSLGIPPPRNSMTPEQAAKATAEAGQVNKNRLVYKNWKDIFENLDKKVGGGKLNPMNYEAVKAHLAGQLVQNHMPQNEAQALVNSMMPAPTDVGETRATKLKQGYEMFKQMESNTPNLDGVPGLKPPFPAPPKLSGGKTEKKKPSGTKDGATSKSKSGKPMVWRDGGWKYAK